MKTLTVLAAVIIAVPAIAMAQPESIQASSVTISDPSGVLSKLLNQWPWLAGLMGWILTARLFAKPFSGWLQNAMDKLLTFTKSTPQLDDDEFVAKLLASWPYRLVAFLVDWSTSVKLPTSSSVADTLDAKSKQSGIAEKLSMLIVVGFMAASFSGCGLINPEGIKPAAVEAGEDAVVVNAERVQETSLFAYERMIKWETTHRAILPVEVSRAVDQARKTFKPNWEASRVALKEYKKQRGDNIENVHRLTTALSVAQSSFLRLTSDQSSGDIGAIFTSLKQLSEAVQTIKK